jgi:hypothetical protein
MWMDSDSIGGFKYSMGNRPRIIMVHAGGVAGWISMANLIFRAKKYQSGDYHYEMNACKALFGMV